MTAKHKSPKKASFGIAELYGRLYRVMSDQERKEFVDASDVDCPFLVQAGSLSNGKTKCSKKGGVCSLRSFNEDPAAPDAAIFGAITTTCPNRFLENQTILKGIGKLILGTENPQIAKEVAFLKREGPAEPQPSEDSAEDGESDRAIVDTEREDVGRIDLVFVHPDKAPLDWCAVEMQAVYFSGGAMSYDFKVIREYKGNGIPFPAKARRPDFRSSGPKRLMPQLQIKVPTLRRWGKKMAVVIDKPFLEAMGQMRAVSDISNADIAWVVVSFEEDNSKATLKIDQVIYTTLESAVEGLTAGHPTTLTDFETRLSDKIGSTPA